MFKVSSRSDALVSLWSLRTAFGFPIDFIADFPWYGRGGEQRKRERVMYGGTCFNAPTEYVNARKFDGHIILTDLCAPKPKPSKCQRMWMTDQHNAKNPYFQTRERVIAIEP